MVNAFAVVYGPKHKGVEVEGEIDPSFVARMLKIHVAGIFMMLFCSIFYKDVAENILKTQCTPPW